MKDFNNYINNVKLQLEENATDDYKNTNVTYTYNNEQIDNNLNYFNKAMNIQLSEYKALLFFNDYLNDINKKDWFKNQIKYIHH